MKKNYFVWMMMIGVAFFISCNNIGEKKESIGKVVQNTILQQEDGTISLKVDKAECYQDMANPSSNTAEWSVEVSKSGRYNVWLSSATKDTTDLQYQNKVMLSILDNRLEVDPGCDKIIHNSSEVIYPYFRADSFVGSLYIQDTGIYNIQVISEKIIQKDLKEKGTSALENSKLLSVFLTPATR
ncbi:MAG: hypothetical protein WCS03_14495 [Bacteroidota bacterium]